MWRLRLCRLFAVAVLTLAPAAGSCACHEEGDDEVKITVVAILATSKNKDVDPQLKEVAKAIQKRKEWKHLTGFSMAQMTCDAVVLGKEKKIKLVDDQCVRITVSSAPSGGTKPYRLRVKAPKLGEVEYECCCKKYLPLATGYQTKDKKLLFIAIMVKTCPEK